MKVIRVENTHHIRECRYEDTEITENEWVTSYPDLERVVYDYGVGSYEGGGYALVYSKGSWDVWDIGHRSCYGPLEAGYSGQKHIFTPEYKTLEEIKEKGSMDLVQDVIDLLIRAEREGWD